MALASSQDGSSIITGVKAKPKDSAGGLVNLLVG